MIQLKKNSPIEYITQFSDKITQRIEETPFFQQADTIALYHALPGEVQTAAFIEKWHTQKQILLPVIKDEDLSLHIYSGKETLKKGRLGILEPNTHSENTLPDLIIVPGIAFDRQLNRLGRGKGYYDRLLSHISAPCMGICFQFQLFDQIPTDTHDQKMNLIITEEEIIVS